MNHNTSVSMPDYLPGTRKENVFPLKIQEKEEVLKPIKWLNILHFYQPLFQDLDILQQVTNECYLPVTRMLLTQPSAKCVININGCLLEMLDERVRGGKEVIDNLRAMFSRGQISITGTGKYHPIFPLIPKSEINRQLHLQEEALGVYFNMQRKPEILYLPEMAYSPDQLELFSENGYNWVTIDESSLTKKTSMMGKYELRQKEGKNSFLVRDRNISEALGKSIRKKYDIDSPEEFVNRAIKEKGNEAFVVTATDVEVFGHHHKERWKLLAEIYDNPSLKSISVEDIAEEYTVAETDTRPSSWSTSKKDILHRVFYPLWFHPQNRLHRLLWQLLDLTLDEVRRHGSDDQNRIMDRLLSSCPFFWASCRPWWNGIIIEKTSDDMVRLLSEVNVSFERVFSVAESIRKKIYEEVSYLNKSGKAKQLQANFLKENNIDISDMEHTLL